jgi:hypothetical protein
VSERNEKKNNDIKWTKTKEMNGFKLNYLAVFDIVHYKYLERISS